MRPTLHQRDREFTVRDFKFEVSGVRPGPKFRAMRAAVLMPALSVRALQDVPKAMQHLHARWRDFVRRMYEGDIPNFSGKAFGYARNCPPFGVVTRDRDKFRCKHPLVCPFCWARTVGNIYDRVVKVLTVPGDRWLRVPPGLVLAESRTVMRVHMDASLPDDAMRSTTMLACLEQLWQSVRFYRDAESKHYLTKRALHVNTVQLEPRGATLRRGALMLVSQGWADADKSYHYQTPDAHTVRWHRKVTRKELAVIVGRVCAYPAKVLDAPPWVVHMLLERFRRVRMWSSRGF